MVPLKALPKPQERLLIWRSRGWPHLFSFPLQAWDDSPSCPAQPNPGASPGLLHASHASWSALPLSWSPSGWFLSCFIVCSFSHVINIFQVANIQFSFFIPDSKRWTWILCSLECTHMNQMQTAGEDGVILPTKQSIQSQCSRVMGLKDKFSQFRNHFTEYCFSGCWF